MPNHFSWPGRPGHYNSRHPKQERRVPKRRQQLINKNLDQRILILIEYIFDDFLLRESEEDGTNFMASNLLVSIKVNQIIECLDLFPQLVHLAVQECLIAWIDNAVSAVPGDQGFVEFYGEFLSVFVGFGQFGDIISEIY